MKALSVRQPWAWLIVRGYKTIENRTWPTNHRGPLAIHASLTVDEDAVRRLVSLCVANGEPLTAQDLREIHTTGAVIGTVNVTDCTQAPQGNDTNWHSAGCWAWVLRKPKPMSPVKVRGALGLFNAKL